jgi:hypothetical protein
MPKIMPIPFKEECTLKSYHFLAILHDIFYEVSEVKTDILDLEWKPLVDGQ